MVVAHWPEDNVGYRAKILEVGTGTILVAFSDYGNEVQVEENNIVMCGDDIPAAVLIEMEDNGLLLNSMGGFNRCVLPQLQVVMGDKPVGNEEREGMLTNFDEILTLRQEEMKRKDPSRLTRDLSLPNKKTKRDLNQREESVKERLDTERQGKEKEKSEMKKEAKDKARKNKVPKLNDKIPPNFDFIPRYQEYLV